MTSLSVESQSVNEESVRLNLFAESLYVYEKSIRNELVHKEFICKESFRFDSIKKIICFIFITRKEKHVF